MVKLVNNGPINDDSDEIDIISYLPYSLPSNLPTILINSKSSFKILSLNTGSLSAKLNSLHLQVSLESLSSKNIGFPVICIQESWISNGWMLQLFQLDGNNNFHVNSQASIHGGVATHVHYSYNVTIKTRVNNYGIWDGLFLYIKHDNLKNKENYWEHI